MIGNEWFMQKCYRPMVGKIIDLTPVSDPNMTKCISNALSYYILLTVIIVLLVFTVHLFRDLAVFSSPSGLALAPGVKNENGIIKYFDKSSINTLLM